MKEIAPRIYVETFYPGVNAGFIHTDGGVVAIDAPPLPADARAWRDRILKATGGPIRHVVLTDHHPDRLLGVGWLEAPVIAGVGTLRLLQEGGDALWRAALDGWNRYRPEEKQMGQFRSIMPSVAVDGRITLHGDVPVVVESVPGTAPGSVWVRLLEQRVVFAGDMVVVGRHPPLAEVPDSRAWLKALVDLRRARTPIRLIVPGRGPVSGKDDTRSLSEYVQRARRRIRSLRNAGGSRGDVAGLVPEFLSLFPVEEGRREEMQRLVRAGLERVYEELRPAKEGE